MTPAIGWGIGKGLTHKLWLSTLFLTMKRCTDQMKPLLSDPVIWYLIGMCIGAMLAW